MRVSEIFSSIQGEGINVGKPCIFVRLAVCNLRCRWCDSKYAYKGKEMSIEEVVDVVKAYPCNHIVWTGGEPTLQINKIYEVINYLGSKYTHEIESNGTVDFDIKPFKLVTISPKKEAIKEEVLRNMSFHTKKVYFKFVVENKKNFEFWMNLVEKLKINKSNVLIMPLGRTHKQLVKNSRWLVELCKKENVRYSPRIQIHIWGKKRGV